MSKKITKRMQKRLGKGWREILPEKRKMKVGDLKGDKNIIRIECSCSDIAIWIAHGNKKFDAIERLKFIETHKDHELSSVQCRSTVF